MARFAIIDAGRVTNIIEADADFAASIGAIDAAGAAIGWFWDGDEFTAPPAPDPAIVRTAKWEAIKTLRDKKVQSGGYKVVVSGVDKWFHSDTFSRTQQMGLVMFGAACPAVPWKTMDGSYVVMSQALAGQIFQAAAVQDQLLFSKAEALRVSVEASTDPGSVDISAGWPDTYLGV